MTWAECLKVQLKVNTEVKDSTVTWFSKTVTSCKRQTPDFTFVTNQECKIFMVSDNLLDNYILQFVKDMPMKPIVLIECI